jgi:hypothetical protein
VWSFGSASFRLCHVLILPSSAFRLYLDEMWPFLLQCQHLVGSRHCDSVWSLAKQL